jgi:anti-anti-sigma factor
MALAQHAVVASGDPRSLCYAERDRDETIVWVMGEHDAATVAELSLVLSKAIAGTRSDVIVDLSGVEFMGVAPVAVLLRAQGFLERRGRSLALRAPSESAEFTLDRCGVDWASPRTPANGVVIVAGNFRSRREPVPAPGAASHIRS